MQATAHMVVSFNSCIGICHMLIPQKPYAYTITFDYTVVEYTYYEMSIIILTMTQKERYVLINVSIILTYT